MEPWDGPAAVAFTDGRVIGATLDRNGLRPGRWLETKDGWVVLGSETGVMDEPASNILRKGRLQPGKLFLVDLEAGRIVADEEVKRAVATRKPYGEWFEQGIVHLRDLPEREPAYGNRLIEEIEEITQGVISVNPNTMYPLLRELEARKLIEGRWEHPDRRTRRYYSITSGGRAEYRRLVSELEPFLGDRHIRNLVSQIRYTAASGAGPAGREENHLVAPTREAAEDLVQVRLGPAGLRVEAVLPLLHLGVGRPPVLGEPLDQPDRPIRRPEQQRPGVRGDRPAIEIGNHPPPIDSCKTHPFRATLCRHRGALLRSRKSLLQKNFRTFRTPMHLPLMRNPG
jgi:DNA-binding PadR family transcriptional regulator